MTLPDLQQPAPFDPNRASRRSGILLLACAGLAVLAMAHHPVVDDHHGTLPLTAAIARQAGLSALVHGLLIVLMWLLTVGLTALVDRCGGWRQSSQRAAFIAWCLGVVSMTGAALISGFVVARLAAGVAPGDAAALAAFQMVLQLCGVGNQILAQVGVCAMSVAIGVWSLGLWQRPALLRAVGVLGLAAALLPALGVFSGRLQLDVSGMGAVVMLQMLWIAAVGALLATRRLQPQQH